MLSLKTVFYKFCFCLGLGTASYYAYAQVQHWAKGDAALPEHRTSALSDKVQSLTRDEVIDAAQRRQMEIHRAEMNRIAHARRPVRKMIKPIAKPVVVAAVSPTPAPSATPEANPEASPSPTETAQNAEMMPPNGMMMPPNGIMPNGLPYGMVMGPDGQLYPAMMDPSMMPMPRAENGPAPASTDGSMADAANGNMGMPAGFNSYTGQGAGYGSSSSGGSTVSGASAASSVLTSQDLATLTSAPVQAAFQDQQNQVNGYMCGSNDQSSCTYQSNVPVHSLRWDTNDGLEKNVNFAVQASSGSTPVQFNVSFKVQDRLLNDQLVTFNAQPNQVSIHSETRDSKNYRVYQFKMPDAVVQGDDQLSQMQATLVYEVTESGMEMTADSNFSFSRAQVKTNSDAWDPSQPQEDSSQNELYFIADELPYSMTLQKSQ